MRSDLAGRLRTVAKSGGLVSRLSRKSLEALVLNAAGAGLLFAMHAMLGRQAGVSAYGIFSYAFGITSILAILAPLGWPTALLRFVREYAEHQDWSLLKGVFRRAYQVTAISSISIAAVLYAASFLEVLPQNQAASLRYVALLLPLLAFVGLRRKALQALGKIKTSIIPEVIMLPLLVIGGTVLLPVERAFDIILLYAGAALVVFAVSNVYLVRSLPEETRGVRPQFRTRYWMAISTPMVFGGVSQIIINRTDVLMLGAMTTPETVGLYGAAVRIALLNTFVLTAVNTVAAPMMSSAFQSGRQDQVRRVLYGAMVLSCLGALPLLAAMMLLPGTILGLFGGEFVAAVPLLQILAVGQFINAITGPVGFGLLMTGRERAFAVTTVIVVIFNVIGNLLAIPSFGAMGAAVVTACSVAALNLWQYWLFRRRPHQ